MKQVEELSIKNLKEANIRHHNGKRCSMRNHLTEYLPTKFNRAMRSAGTRCSVTLLYTQRPFLEGATVLLDRYGDLLTGGIPLSAVRCWRSRVFKPVTLISSALPEIPLVYHQGLLKVNDRTDRITAFIYIPSFSSAFRV
jgi:hypothetical protein